MKNLEFKSKTSQRIYNDYIKRSKRMLSPLSKEDREDVLMEFNSHIYEGTKSESEAKETDSLMDILDKLGSPEEVLKPLVAEKKLEQAVRTFNPLHIFKALVMNIGNGIAYMFFALLYLFLGVFVFTIFAKICNPAEVGLFFQDGSFSNLGMIDLSHIQTGEYVEVLGHWFIPVMIIVSIAWYFLITFLLRLFKMK